MQPHGRRVGLPGHPLRREPGRPCSARSARSRPSSPSGWPSSSARASCSRRSGCACARRFDLEMMEQIGFCSGIENYSRHIDGRAARRAAELPARLLPRRLPRRHRRVARDGARRSAPCTRATRRASARSSSTGSGCRARSTTARSSGTSSRSASARRSTSRRRPGAYEMGIADGVVEQIIRPTGLVDPRSS